MNSIVASEVSQGTPQPGRPKKVTQPAAQTKQDGKTNQQPAAPPLAPATVQQQPPGNTSPNSTAIAKQNPQQTTEQSITVRSLPPIDTRRDWVDYSTIAMTLLLFAVAIVQIVLLRHTLRATALAAKAARANASAASANAIAARDAAEETRRQNELIASQSAVLTGQLEAAKVAADATGVSAKAALDAIRVSRETAEIIERAYISIPEICLQNFEPDKPLGLLIEVKNTGHVPAHLVSISLNLFTDEELPPIPSHDNWGPAIGVVPPNGSFVTHIDQFIGEPRLSKEQYEGAIAGTFRLRVAGAIRYLDGFDKTRESGFGFFYNPKLGGKPAIAQRFSFSNNPSYNYMK